MGGDLIFQITFYTQLRSRRQILKQEKIKAKRNKKKLFISKQHGSEAEFKKFKPRRWTDKNRFLLSAGPNLQTLNTI